MTPDNKAWHYEMMWWHGRQCYYYACLGERVGLAMMSEYKRHSKQMKHHSEMHRVKPAEQPLILTPEQIMQAINDLHWSAGNVAVALNLPDDSLVWEWIDGVTIMPTNVAKWLIGAAHYARTHPAPEPT